MYRQTFGKAATVDTLTFLRREVMHAVWKLLLDDDFIDAYRNGIIIKFHDGTERLVFPRFFTYSADYPEKYDFTMPVSVDLKLLPLQGSPCMHKTSWQYAMSTVSSFEGSNPRYWQKG